MALYELSLYTMDMTFPRRLVMLSRSRKFGSYPKNSWANWAVGTIQSSIALLVLVSFVYPSRTIAANPDLETILTSSRQRIEKLDYRMTGRLTRVEGDGKRTNYKFVAKAHWFPGAWLTEDQPSLTYERERAGNHPGGTSWREDR
jgi:hypothetical protein